MNDTTEMMDFYVMLDESELRIALASIIDVWHKDKGKTAEEARQFTKSLAELQEKCHETFGFFDEEEEQE